MITVETWPVSQVKQARDLKTLTSSPEYQRRPVWAPKVKMLLIDSIARGVPVGAITLYKDSSPGYDTYEVIDGKQRLTALFEFLDDKLSIKTSQIASAALDDDEFSVDDDEVTANFHDRTFSALGTAESYKLQQYKIPVFIVSGERSDAIRAFTRMNRNTYTLKPQEIRNAFFAGTGFLASVVDAITELDTRELGDTGTSESSVLVRLGTVSKQSWDRMQDVQLTSELLVLLMHGAQHRRDTLDHYYSLYSLPKGPTEKALKESTERLTFILSQLWALAGGTPLQAFHFPGTCEHDLYGLVGAIHERGPLTKPQVQALGEELMLVISTFRAQVEEFIAKIRDGQQPGPDEFDPLVEKYGRGFLGGQTNAKSRREDRITTWLNLINGVVATLDTKATFTETQRRLIWARSADKACARCGATVTWDNYHAGHITARAHGGRTVTDNGQVEHSACNLSAGAGAGDEITPVTFA
jgi:hypothetical protein